MAGQPGFFDLSDVYEALSVAGDRWSDCRWSSTFACARIKIGMANPVYNFQAERSVLRDCGAPAAERAAR